MDIYLSFGISAGFSSVSEVVSILSCNEVFATLFEIKSLFPSIVFNHGLWSNLSLFFMGFLMDVRFMGRGVKTTKIGQFCTKLHAFWYKIKQKFKKKKKKKKKMGPSGFFL